MNPQDNDPNMQTTPIQQPSAKSHNSMLLVLLGLFATVAVASTLLLFMTRSKVTKSETDLSTAQQRVDEISTKLEVAEQKIAELDNPERKENDQVRKTHLVTFVATLSEYAQNHQGQYPSTEPTMFKSEFLDLYKDEFADLVDPDTDKAYTVTPVANVQTPPGLVLGDIQYQWPGKCTGSEFSDDANQRQAAARILLESGETYCLDV